MKELISPEPLPSFDQVFLEKIVKIIKENISNSDLNVEFLADRIGMSRVQLYRRIKELTTQSPSDFIKTIRIKQAAELLTQQKANISEIAYSVGFSNLSHFSNSFKEFYGISPSEYAFKNRNNHLFWIFFKLTSYEDALQLFDIQIIVTQTLRFYFQLKYFYFFRKFRK